MEDQLPPASRTREYRKRSIDITKKTVTKKNIKWK